MCLLERLPFRSSKPFIWYRKLMCAIVGNHVELDILKIHDMCMLTIEDGATIQNDVILSSHTFSFVRDTKLAASSGKDKGNL